MNGLPFIAFFSDSIISFDIVVSVNATEKTESLNLVEVKNEFNFISMTFNKERELNTDKSTDCH